MTMSDTVVQAFRFAEEGRATATENGCFDGQEVNKVKSPADCGGLLFQNEDDKFDRHVPETEQIHDESRQKRGISFPRDSCVSGYCEPPDPWREALTWTSEDILSAYKRSCEKHGTKPLSKILQQLEGFICNGKRKEKLVLKGEKIDSKQCEAFEEILRRVQFKSIDLEACHLDDESAVAWFDMIEYYESACCLSIAYNKNIGVRGWQACSRLIRRTPCLTSLDIRNCDMNDRSIPVFGRALKLGSHLTVLHMENMYLSGRSLIILVAALKLNEVLQELFLADNRLMPSDGIQLGNLLKYNHSLTLLDLRNNHLQDVGVSHVCDGLYEQNLDKGLRTLVLWNNQITYQAMASLSRALGSTKCLETLNLGHNNVTNEGIHVLKEGLLKSKSLLRLGLQSTRLTCEGAVALAEYVADSFSLLRLDLRENDIKTAGLMALSLALKVNESVTRMDIDRETKKESGMKDYADQQRRLQQEIKEYLERNQQRVFQKEEEDRQRLEERAQVEMVICQPVQSDTTFAQETIQPQPEMIYAPTSSMESERQRRPSLLFKAHCLTPQESLESPHCGDVHFFPGNTGKVVIPEVSLSSPPLSLELPNPLTSPTAAASIVESTSGDNLAPLSNPLTSALHSPPVELLLSPQYYPKPTARKIFSVSRVIEVSPASPTVSKTGLLDIGASKVSNTSVMTLSGNNGAGGSLSSISPTLLCQDLSVKTVNDYIQQIVNDSTSLAGNCEEKEAARQKNELCVTDSIMEDSFCGGQENVLNQWQEREDDYQSIQDVCLLAQDGCGNFDPLGVMQAQASPISREVMSSTSCDITQDNPAYFCLDSESYPYRGTEDVRVDRDNMQTEGAIVSREDEILSRNIAIAGADVECIPLSAEFSLSNQIPGQGLCVPQSEVIADSVQADLKETEDHIDILAENDLAVEEELVRSALLENSHMDKMKSIAACVVGQKLSQKSSPQLPATHLVPEEPSLFETMEFPSFDLNEDDLNLFGIGDSKLSSSSGGSNSGLSDTWFAIDACNLGGHQKEENVGDAGEKQPDFFTPLSMNGLTQELASALNSIDETLSGADEQEDRSVMYSTDKALDMEDKGSLF